MSSEKKILHLVTDEKFTDYAIRQFSAPEMHSEFVLIPSNYLPGESEVQAIDQCRVVERHSKDFEQLLLDLKNYAAIILHGMHWAWWQTPILKAIPSDVKVAWVFWGGELYGLPDIANTFLAPIGKFLNKLHITRRKLSGAQLHEIAGVSKEYYTTVDYCLTALPVEYEFAKRYLHRPDMKYLWYNYYSIEETLGALIDKQCSGNNIWVGNSATIECNYFDLLPKLKRFDLSNRKIIIPLSYGSPWIQKRIRQLGRWLFGKHFAPLLDYLPREEYNAQMLSCSTMIQPHYLSQGVGNILTGLWLGMRLYISEKCITYDYLKQIGVRFYTIEHDLRRDNPEVFAPMTQEDIEHNRCALMKETGLQRTIEANKLLVEELLK